MLNENYVEPVYHKIQNRKYSKLEKQLIECPVPEKIIEKALVYIYEFQVKYEKAHNFPPPRARQLIFSSIFKAFHFYNKTIDQIFLFNLLFPDEKLNKVHSFMNKVFEKYLQDVKIEYKDLIPFYIDNYMSHLSTKNYKINHMNRETIIKDIYKLLNDFLENQDEKIQTFLKETSMKHVVIAIMTHYIIENEMYSCKMWTISSYMCNPAIQKYLDIYESLIFTHTKSVQ